VVFGLDLVLGLATGATWLIIAFFLRYSSVASMVSAVFAPVFYLFGDRIQWYAEKPVLLALFVMALLLVCATATTSTACCKATNPDWGQKK
jgi:glycerol-3-phosphate acyltransferase PlsY